MTVQILKTPSGDELVVLPLDEYKRLVALAMEAEEDAADIAAYDAAKAEHNASGQQILPQAVSAMMLKGMSLLRALRKWRGMTQVELAGKAGIQQGFLSDIELDRRKGSTETLVALAGALDVPRGWVV
jgi:DNA-binding XRE family transcriptional regulator